MERTIGLRIIRSLFPDQLNVPYVPTVFRATNPPSQADVGVFKSDAPIPDSVTTKSHGTFHQPVAISFEDAPIIEEDPLTSSDESLGDGGRQPRGRDNPSCESREERVPAPSSAPGAIVGQDTSGTAGTPSTSTPAPSPTPPATSTGPMRRVLQVPRKLIVKRAKTSVAELNLQLVRVPSAASAQGPMDEAIEVAAPDAGMPALARTSPPSAAAETTDVEEVGDRGPTWSAEQSSHQGVPPPRSGPLGTSAPKVSPPESVNEIPVGLIEDDLLDEDLCHNMLNSLRRVYKHHKSNPALRVKSSILAVKSEGLQPVPVLKQELEEKGVVIAELRRQLATARESGGVLGAASTSSQYQEELARVQRERERSSSSRLRRTATIQCRS
ncbi:hypothetical protein PVAP13_8NG185900 [Panicum virgatum]|uniref:Uncharacterized protein n=1 Tax=Panicum virgatum TaxID=38727 RepID=A0A8T0P4D2_PANVG|nr:hypothetical protein PVAP13_8NG185900 [Panicum virgatum]